MIANHVFVVVCGSGLLLAFSFHQPHLLYLFALLITSIPLEMLRWDDTTSVLVWVAIFLLTLGTVGVNSIRKRPILGPDGWEKPFAIAMAILVVAACGSIAAEVAID